MNYSLDYWQEYNSSIIQSEPSSFGIKCASLMKGSVLDICCGDCRDSDWFHSQGLDVKAFDIVEYDKPYDYRVINLMDRSGFTFDNIDNVYCRFVLHAVPEYLEDYILVESSHYGGKLFIEARSDKGTEDGTHYRRLINYDKLISKLKNIGFDILYSCEDSGLSVDHDDPILIRVIAQKVLKDIDLLSWDDFYKHTSIDPDSAKHLLLSVRTILTGIPFYLAFGTLLGAYRENDFIKYDTDIDIVLLDSQRDAVSDLIDSGYFALYGLELVRNLDALYSFRYKDDHIDLYFFTRRKDKYWCWQSYSIGHSLIDKDPTVINFIGHDFQTFSNIEKYLTCQYGDWRIPVNYEL